MNLFANIVGIECNISSPCFYIFEWYIDRFVNFTQIHYYILLIIIVMSDDKSNIVEIDS